MTTKPEVVVVASAAPAITRTLLRLLIAAITVLAVVCAVLSFAYLRVANQLDQARSASRTDSQVLGEVREAVDEVRSVAALFAALADPDEAVRAATREELARLADEIRDEQEAAQRSATPSPPSSTAAPATTTTTAPAAPTTTTTTTTTTTPPPEPDPPGEGVRLCVGPIRIGDCP